MFELLCEQLKRALSVQQRELLYISAFKYLPCCRRQVALPPNWFYGLTRGTVPCVIWFNTIYLALFYCAQHPLEGFAFSIGRVLIAPVFKPVQNDLPVFYNSSRNHDAKAFVGIDRAFGELPFDH